MTETPQTLRLDVAKYEAYLADTDLTEDEKRAFLEALWSVIISFVDLGFSVLPCEKTIENKTLGAQDVVHLTHAQDHE